MYGPWSLFLETMLQPSRHAEVTCARVVGKASQFGHAVSDRIPASDYMELVIAESYSVKLTWIR